MLETLLEYDSKLFKIINQEWLYSWFDWILPNITNFSIMKPYLILLVIIWLLVQRKYFLRVFLGCALAVAIGDLGATKILKPFFHRDRPQFHETHARLLVPSQGSPSFPSNHATNTSAVAWYLWFCASPMASVGFLVAFMISYSRVYVGVHYPLDVLGGFFWGMIAAMVSYIILTSIFGSAYTVRPAYRIPLPPKSLRRLWRRRSRH